MRPNGGIQWQVAVNLSVQRNPLTLRIIDLGAVLVAAVVINEVFMSLRLGMVVELHQSLLSRGVRGHRHLEGC